MKYILILLTTGFVLGQVYLPIHAEEIDASIIEWSEDKGFHVPDTQCFNTVWEFTEGWERMFDGDSTCKEIIDVRITVGGKTIDYTAEEFMKRLGFKEFKQ